jgi:DNA-3-methyladenine glycosylase II
MKAKPTAKPHMGSPHHRRKALRTIKINDAVMSELIKNVGSLRMEVDRSETPFHFLARSIVYQQLAGSAASAIHKRVHALYPKRKEMVPQDLLKTPMRYLRKAGLSKNKALAILDLAKKCMEGIIPEKSEMDKLSDQEIIDRITQVRGIGPWTVEMMLIFHLGRPDVMPATDYGVRKGFALTFKKRNLPTPKELLAYSEKWRPYRSVASWYLWRSLELED